MNRNIFTVLTIVFVLLAFFIDMVFMWIACIMMALQVAVHMND